MFYSHNCLVLIYFNDLAYKVKDELLLWSNFCTKKYFMLAILLPLSDPLIVLTFPNSLSRKKRLHNSKVTIAYVAAVYFLLGREIDQASNGRACLG